MLFHFRFLPPTHCQGRAILQHLRLGGPGVQRQPARNTRVQQAGGDCSRSGTCTAAGVGCMEEMVLGRTELLLLMQCVKHGMGWLMEVEGVGKID